MKDILFIGFIVAFIIFAICALSYAAINLFGVVGAVGVCTMSAFIIGAVVLNLITINKEK